MTIIVCPRQKKRMWWYINHDKIDYLTQIANKAHLLTMETNILFQLKTCFIINEGFHE